MTETATPTAPLKGISSMATRQVLAALTAQYAQATGQRVVMESVGGVDAAKRVAAGERFDLVLLAADAIDKLLASGHARAGSRCDWVSSGVAACVRIGRKHPDFSSEATVKQAVLDAKSLGYSTGPSGVALAQLFERWGIAQQITPRIVTAPPGVPVASLVAQGEIELGFQQLSELIHVPGIDIIGPLPPEIQITTLFSSAITSTCIQPEAAQQFLSFLASAPTSQAKKAQGMTPLQN
jgi:molybdate transport system substrate-binding protein